MITEKAYLPISLRPHWQEKAYLTKGMWEVKRDYMAGPFVNYMVEDLENKRWMVVEGSLLLLQFLKETTCSSSIAY